MSAENPVSPKAIASTSGAGIGAALATLLNWSLGVTVWGASGDAAGVTGAIAAVPTPVSAVVAIIIPAAVAAISGWRVSDPHRVTSTELKMVQATRAQQQQR